MKAHVLEYVWRESHGKPFKYTKQWQTEDLYFFDLANQGGYRVVIDMDMKLGHVGTKTWVPPEVVEA